MRGSALGEESALRLVQYQTPIAPRVTEKTMARTGRRRAERLLRLFLTSVRWLSAIDFGKAIRIPLRNTKGNWCECHGCMVHRQRNQQVTEPGRLQPSCGPAFLMHAWARHQPVLIKKAS